MRVGNLAQRWRAHEKPRHVRGLFPSLSEFPPSSINLALREACRMVKESLTIPCVQNGATGQARRWTPQAGLLRGNDP
jgi:hypothetical protein